MPRTLSSLSTVSPESKASVARSCLPIILALTKCLNLRCITDAVPIIAGFLNKGILTIKKITPPKNKLKFF